MKKRATQDDVARLAGVSRATVSYVINNLSGGNIRISEQTRQRVLDAIRELNYQPNALARSLATQRTNTLALVVPDIANPFFAGIARGVERVARSANYVVLLGNAEEDPKYESKLLEILEERRVDGVVSCSSRLPDRDLRGLLEGYPVAVLVNRLIAKSDNRTTIDSVVIDEVAGGRLATQHLLFFGCQIIGMINGPVRSFSARGREKGYRNALEAAGLPVREEIILHCQPTVESGQKAAEKLLTNHPEVTALFCYDDMVAIGTLKAAKQLARRVPGDLAIVGFDDSLLAGLVTPPLTTCRVPKERLGEFALQLLLDRINNPSDPPKELVIQPELIVRESAPAR